MGTKLKGVLTRYRHGWLLSYFLIYIVWFAQLEKHSRVKYVIRSWVDAYIPFEEIFVIPYFLWFGYVGTTLVYFLLKSKEDYYRTCMFLFTGMTVCLIIYTLFPNGQYLRPYVFARDNVLVRVVQWLYAADTPTNVCPSIHALNSIGVNFAVWHSPLFQKNRKVRYGSLILMVLICLSTVFLKQHSVTDVFYAAVLSVPLYLLSFRLDWSPIFQSWAERIALRRERQLHNN